VGVLCSVALASQVIDRTMAIVDAEVITESEVVLQGRLEAMANNHAFSDSPELREELLSRLIDQRLIANGIRITGLPSMNREERDLTLEQLRAQQYETLSFDDALDEYRLTPGQVLEFHVQQIEFARYVNFRFRTGQTVSDAAVAELYDAKYGQLPTSEAPTLQVVRPQLRREILTATVERQLQQHIRQLRADTRVVRLAPINRAAVVDRQEVQ
jgi:hypothetical protein